ncbi:hypothetical protein JNJ66_06275 [Candidatus Saccharibacteria bacterium]|nr:hypothetical protein [Candidatus Saccharibacteria bacterium]
MFTNRGHLFVGPPPRRFSLLWLLIRAYDFKVMPAESFRRYAIRQARRIGLFSAMLSSAVSLLAAFIRPDLSRVWWFAVPALLLMVLAWYAWLLGERLHSRSDDMILLVWGGRYRRAEQVLGRDALSRLAASPDLWPRLAVLARPDNDERERMYSIVEDLRTYV